MLSILVTYYNQEKYVSRSLNSIFNQNLTTDFEVLIGDDGSQDDTCKIVEDYQKKYPDKIRLFIQPRDLNVKYNPVERASKNRLDLLKNAKGDYVCFLDGDDEYCDYNWLQESVDILDKDHSLVGVAHNYCEKYSDGRIITPAGIGHHEYITAKLYAKQLYIHAGTILFRNAFNEDDYNLLISLKSFDDNDITFYFLNYGNLKCVDKVVYTYYQNSESIWNSTNDLEKAIINSIDYEVIKKILKKYHGQLAIKYFPVLNTIYRNKEELKNPKYHRYLNQTVANGMMQNFFLWDKISCISRVKTKFNLLKIRFHVKFENFIPKGYRLCSSLLKQIVKKILFLFVNKNLVIVKIDGGICSQMVQYAEGLLFEKRKVKYDVSWFKDNGYDLLHKDKRNFDLLKLFPELKFKKASKLELALYKKKYATNETDFDLLTKNNEPMYLGSYYHYPLEGYKQFHRIFNFQKAKINEESKRVLEKIKLDTYSCAVHIRRGDLADNATAIKSGYLSGVCTENYFANTIKYIANLNPACKFYLFSDDLEYVEKCLLPLLSGYNCELVTANNAENGYLDLYLMAYCNCQISSLGSLGIYGWLLNKHDDKYLITTKESYYNCAENRAALFTSDGELKMKK